MVTSNDWHSISKYRNKETIPHEENLDKQLVNTSALQHFVKSSVAQFRLHHDGSKVPFLIFQKLKTSYNVLKQIDVEAYPASSRSYQKYVLYNHIEDGLPPFSFTLIVFAPNQKTPKHSHRVDCAPICLKGLVKETLYREADESHKGTSPKLEVIRTQIYKPYEGAYLLKCEPNIHHLENASHNSISMSLHLYLFDACCPKGKSSSILKVYR